LKSTRARSNGLGGGDSGEGRTTRKEDSPLAIGTMETVLRFNGVLIRLVDFAEESKGSVYQESRWTVSNSRKSMK